MATTSVPTARPDDARLSRVTGIVLRGGVIIAASLVLIGLVLFFAGHDVGGPKTLDEATGKSGTTYDVSISTIWDGLTDGSSLSFIELGLLALILTPTVRVAVTAYFLARNRERILTGMAVFVLILLILGLFGIDG